MIEAVRDEAKAMAILTEITETVMDALSNGSPGDVAEQFREIVSSVLTANGVDQYHEQITRQVLRMFERRTVAVNGLNVDHVNIDLIKQTPFDFLLSYGTPLCGANTFRELRQAVQQYAFLPFEEARAFARGLNCSGQAEWFEWCRTAVRPTTFQ
jgi:hypothetical protein